jgi:hypothetical protein
LSWQNSEPLMGRCMSCNRTSGYNVGTIMVRELRVPRQQNGPRETCSRGSLLPWRNIHTLTTFQVSISPRNRTKRDDTRQPDMSVDRCNGRHCLVLDLPASVPQPSMFSLCQWRSLRELIF